MGIGIDFDCDRIRAAVWNAEDGTTVSLASIPCQVAFTGPSKALVGEAAAVLSETLDDSTPVPLVGVQRLLGRSYASLAGAKWLEREASHCLAELIPAAAAAQPADDDDGDDAVEAGVRLRLTFKRPAPSGLKKRGASAGSSKGTAAFSI